MGHPVWRVRQTTRQAGEKEKPVSEMLTGLSFVLLGTSLPGRSLSSLSQYFTDDSEWEHFAREA